MTKLLLRLTALLFGAATANAQLIINEFRRDGGSLNTTEYIEFVLTQDLSTIQLNSYVFGDSTSTTAGKYSAYRFNLGGDTTYYAGTIITIGGSVTSDTTYNPTASVADSNWNLAFTINSSSIIRVNGTNVGDFAATDVVWVDTSSSGITSIHAINWDSTPGLLGANADVTIGPLGTTATVGYIGANSGLDVVGNYILDYAGSLGSPNGGANSAYITSLRETVVAVPEPHVYGLTTVGLLVIAAAIRRRKARAVS
jgi:hypothetical protein